MKGEVMNDIVTVRIEHRNWRGVLQDKSEEFDVDVDNPNEINTRIKQFISTKTIFPDDSIKANAKWVRWRD